MILIWLYVKKNICFRALWEEGTECLYCCIIENSRKSGYARAVILLIFFVSEQLDSLLGLDVG